MAVQHLPRQSKPSLIFRSPAGFERAHKWLVLTRPLTPSKVLSDYTGEMQEEDATGRFHASLASTRLAFEKVGGWPLTLRGDFDQQLIARLNGLGSPADPCMIASPSYVFRWGSTGAYHGQALMRGPEDTTWYGEVQAQ